MNSLERSNNNHQKRSSFNSTIRISRIEAAQQRRISNYSFIIQNEEG